VGLVAPHALRPAVGSLGRHLLPAAFLAGALLVVLADLGTRVLSDRVDLPLGSLTAFVGAPYFLFALRAGERRT
jgi:iron complex transport system permease protein